jgi:hypothetical protein
MDSQKMLLLSCHLKKKNNPHEKIIHYEKLQKKKKSTKRFTIISLSHSLSVTIIGYIAPTCHRKSSRLRNLYTRINWKVVEPICQWLKILLQLQLLHTKKGKIHLTSQPGFFKCIGRYICIIFENTMQRQVGFKQLEFFQF